MKIGESMILGGFVEQEVGDQGVDVTAPSHVIGQAAAQRFAERGAVVLADVNRAKVMLGRGSPDRRRVTTTPDRRCQAEHRKSHENEGLASDRGRSKFDAS
jgi:NAD(P)-dependent dehydrogenase (short-subunit alcohol dehydrogenase family)